MLPRGHIISGIILILAVFILSPQINFIYLALLFLASFLIDFDHYTASVLKTKRWGLKNALDYNNKKMIEEKKEKAKGIKAKDDFHFFHTVEFHVFVGFLSVLWIGFFYVFVGMVYHSLLDIFSLIRGGSFHRREFFLFDWVRKKSKKADNSFCKKQESRNP